MHLNTSGVYTLHIVVIIQFFIKNQIKNIIIK